MNRVFLILGALALALGLTFLAPMSVAADSPLQALSADNLNVAIEVQDNGEWIAHIGGEGGLALASADISAIAKFVGYDIPVALDASMLQMAKDNGIGSLGLVKEGEKSTIVLNGVAVTAVTISDAAVAEGVKSFLPELDNIASWLNKSSLTLVAYFPSLGGTAKVASLEAAAPAAAPVNVIDLGATISPKGELLSAGGVSMADLGFSGMFVDLSWLQTYGINIKDASVALNAWGASVTSGGTEWVKVEWNPDLVVASVPEVAAAAGMPLGDADLPMVQLAADWLKSTQINVGAYIADAPMEADATVKIGRPVEVAINEGALMVEGVNTGFMLDAMTLGIVKDLGGAAVAWDGSANQLRLSVGDKPMPAVMMDAGFLTEVGTSTMGNWLPWASFEALLSKASFSADLSVDGVKAVAPDYTVAAPTAAAPLALDLKVSRADGRIEAFGEALPLDLLMPSISSNVLWVVQQAGPGIQALNLDLGPGGLTVGVNGKNAYLAWDSTLRSNLVSEGLDIGGKQFGLPAIATSGIVSEGIKMLLGLATSTDVGINVSFTDQPIPQGSIESLAKSVALF